LNRREWLELSRLHRESLETRLAPWRAYRRQGRKHPVIDFLFQYYSFPVSRLLSWTPGSAVALEGPAGELPGSRFEVCADGYYRLRQDKKPLYRLKALDWTVELLQQTLKNSSCLSCFGLHEWAMLYKVDKARHQTPLRISSEVLEQTVEKFTLQCTHYDALRFYTASARPLNIPQPDRDPQKDFEQSACLHANMDLYKWAYKVYPWVSSDLLRRCFELAMDCREIDMRSSPYDVSGFALEVIAVETAAGREEYIRHQQRIRAAAEPLRRELLELYECLLQEARVQAE